MLISKKKGIMYYPKYFNPILIIVILTILVRLIFISETGYISDINTFKSWALMLGKDGLQNFYYADAFTDYPPAYMYILFIIGKIYLIFNINTTSLLSTIIIKSPAIIFDVLTVALIYKISIKRMRHQKAFIVSLFYALNPAIFIDSAIWGQVDSIYTFFILCSIYLISNVRALDVTTDKNDNDKPTKNRYIIKNYVIGYILFTIAVLLKPQALIFCPIYIFIFIDYFTTDFTNKQKICTSIFSVIICMLVFLLVCLPFINGFDIGVILHQYVGTLSQYDYQTLNAYNFYALLGNNFVNVIAPVFYTIPANIFGLFCVIFFTIITFVYLFVNRNNKFSLFLSVAFINTATFLFCVKMHERYLFPTLLFLLIAYIYSNDKKLLALFFGFSFTLYVNCFDVIKLSLYDYDYSLLKYGLSIISFINLALFVFLFYIVVKTFEVYVYDEYIPNKEERYCYEVEEPIEKKCKFIFSKKDLMLIIIITLIYSVIGFYNLGSAENPKTYARFDKGDQIVVTFPQSEHIKSINILNGVKNDKSITINDNENKGIEQEISLDDVFKWEVYPIDEDFKNVTITFNDNQTYIHEIGFIDNDDNVIEIQNVLCSNSVDDNEVKKVFDEQDNIELEYDYTNSTYFDEIYHARTAFEYVEGLPTYENTHPPLGKDLIAVGIKLFGMSPFNYRLMGVIFGIIMIPFIYMFSLQMFKKTEFALFSSLLLSFDFMHFSQTRLATIDSFVTFFILCMYYFMYLYYQRSFYFDNNRKLYKYLAFSGIFMGFAVATKWTGVYGGIGLGILFFITMFKRYNEYTYEKLSNNQRYTSQFLDKTQNTIVFCVLSFVVVPIIIYCVSYIPYLRANDLHGISAIIENQQHMFSYHSSLYVTHPYASDWWTWLLDLRPVYYYANKVSDTVIAGISGFGNPFIWLMGTVSLLYTFTRLKTDNRNVAIFLLIGYLSQIVPWIFVARTMFMYHYFPATIFMILMITNMFNETFKTIKNKYVLGYMALVILCFIAFYPVLSGMDINEEYLRALRWLPTWVLGPSPM